LLHAGSHFVHSNNVNADSHLVAMMERVISNQLAPITNYIQLSAPLVWEIFRPPSNPSTTTDAPTGNALKRAAQNAFFDNLKQAYMAGGKLKCMVLGVELPRSALSAGHLFPKWLATKKYDNVFGFEVDSVRNGVIWCTAIEKVWDEQRVSFFLQPETKPGQQVYLLRVMYSDLLDVKLVDVAQQMVGKNMLPVAYKAALGDTKYRDLDGKVELTFPTSHAQPYQGAFVWQALAAHHFASSAGKLPATVDVQAILTPSSPVAQKIKTYFDSMRAAAQLSFDAPG